MAAWWREETIDVSVYYDEAVRHVDRLDAVSTLETSIASIPPLAREPQ